MLKLGRAQGVAIAVALSRDLLVSEYAPKKIKLVVTGKGFSSKTQVAGMLKQILNADLIEANLDATDALAVAVCHTFQNKSASGGGKKYGSWSSFAKDNPNRLK